MNVDIMLDMRRARRMGRDPWVPLTREQSHGYGRDSLPPQSQDGPTAPMQVCVDTYRDRG